MSETESQQSKDEIIRFCQHKFKNNKMCKRPAENNSDFCKLHNLKIDACLDGRMSINAPIIVDNPIIIPPDPPAGPQTPTESADNVSLTSNSHFMQDQIDLYFKNHYKRCKYLSSIKQQPTKQTESSFFKIENIMLIAGMTLLPVLLKHLNISPNDIASNALHLKSPGQSNSTETGNQREDTKEGIKRDEQTQKGGENQD